MRSLSLLLTSSLQRSLWQKLSIFTCLHFFQAVAVLQKFQGSGESRFGSSENHYFLKIPKWQHELVQKYKWGKLVSYFLNNAANPCSQELKISENFQIKYVFQSKAFFHLSNFLHTSCFSTFDKTWTIPFLFYFDIVGDFFFSNYNSKCQLLLLIKRLDKAFAGHHNYMPLWVLISSLSFLSNSSSHIFNHFLQRFCQISAKNGQVVIYFGKFILATFFFFFFFSFKIDT